MHILSNQILVGAAFLVISGIMGCIAILTSRNTAELVEGLRAAASRYQQESSSAKSALIKVLPAEVGEALASSNMFALIKALIALEASEREKIGEVIRTLHKLYFPGEVTPESLFPLCYSNWQVIESFTHTHPENSYEHFWAMRILELVKRQ